MWKVGELGIYCSLILFVMRNTKNSFLFFKVDGNVFCVWLWGIYFVHEPNNRPFCRWKSKEKVKSSLLILFAWRRFDMWSRVFDGKSMNMCEKRENLMKYPKKMNWSQNLKRKTFRPFQTSTFNPCTSSSTFWTLKFPPH